MEREEARFAYSRKLRPAIQTIERLSEDLIALREQLEGALLL